MEIYDFFDEPKSLVFSKDNIDDMRKTLTKDIINRVVAIEMTSLGAMRIGGLMLLVTDDGTMYPIYYLDHSEDKNHVKIFKSIAYDYLNELFDGCLDNISWRHTKEFKEGWTYTEEEGWFIIAKDTYFKHLYDLGRNEAEKINFVIDMHHIAQHMVHMHFPSYMLRITSTIQDNPNIKSKLTV